MDSLDRKAEARRLGAEAAIMRDLLHTLMWTRYAAHLETLIDGWVAQLLTGTKDEFEYRKGVVMGLREALRAPETIIEWSERANQN